MDAGGGSQHPPPMHARDLQGSRSSLGDIRSPPMGYHPQQQQQHHQQQSSISSNGPMPVPAMNGFGGHMRTGSNAGMPSQTSAAHLSRSPPNAKNTAHVPCKFFRQGNCQAGSACPFLHTVDADAPCKYFQMGKCKYGQKCALAHILPNGRRANPPMPPRGSGGGGGGQRQFMPDPFFNDSSAFGGGAPQPFGQQFSMAQDMAQTRRSLEQASPFDAFGTSPRDSNFGSPPTHARGPYSPKVTAQDVTLPSSFDPNAQSNYASLARQNGTISSSIPASTTSLLGWSPFSSKTTTTSTTRQQAFGNLDSTLLSGGAEGRTSLDDRIGVSPPSNSQSGLSPQLMGIGTQVKRPLHSERRPVQFSKASSSLPVESRHLPNVDDFLLDPDEESAEFGLQEERVPEALNELLTPQERQRRFSRTQDDFTRPSLSGFGSPADSKVGSPTNASPSRFGPLFERQRRDASDSLHPSSPSARGYFGSPLGRSPRIDPQSAGGMSSSPSFGVIGPPSKSGNVSPQVSSPPRAGGMSLLSQQLKRTHLGSDQQAEAGETGRAANSGGRTVSSSSIGSVLSGVGRFDRAVSSNSITHERIDEEPLEVFSMDDEDEAAAKDKRERQGQQDTSSNGARATSYAGVAGAQGL